MSSTYSVTMANLKPEDTDSSTWQGYSLQTPTTTPSLLPSFDLNYQTSGTSISSLGRSQRETFRPLDMPSVQTRPQPRIENRILTGTPLVLNTHHSYPSLKRSFQETEEAPYMEHVQNYRDDLSDVPKPTINQDNRLLSFGRLPNKHTILDSHGRAKQIDLVAQIHGMFFLSELATPSGETAMVQPELTCYRRNLFQISGSVTTPRGSLSFLSERGERIPITSMDLCISATESVDSHIVKLIVIPWKTPPPNSPEIAPGQEQEPAPIPVVPDDEGSEGDSETVECPIAYRRLQFRIATANNGRRRELQQHFTLHLKVVGTLANGSKVNVCETSTAPIVVRGRSPRNFQARKEIPLAGSSSSRGNPPELHLSTTNMGLALSSEGRGRVVKQQGVELSRPPFTFDSPSSAPAPLSRLSTYPMWSAGNAPDHSTAPTTPSYPASAISLDTYLQPSHPITQVSSPSAHGPASAMSAPPISNQPNYAYPVSAPAQTVTPLRYIDSNPRPIKSPRHGSPPQLPSSAAYQDYGTRFSHSYAAGSTTHMRTAEYFPTIAPMQTWTAAPDSGVVYGTSAQAPGVQHYEFPSEQQSAKEESRNQHAHYTWNPS